MSGYAKCGQKSYGRRSVCTAIRAAGSNVHQRDGQARCNSASSGRDDMSCCLRLHAADRSDRYAWFVRNWNARLGYEGSFDSGNGRSDSLHGNAVLARCLSASKSKRSWLACARLSGSLPAERGFARPVRLAPGRSQHSNGSSKSAQRSERCATAERERPVRVRCGALCQRQYAT